MLFFLRFLMDPRRTNYRLEQHLRRAPDKERLHREGTAFPDNGLSATN